MNLTLQTYGQSYQNVVKAGDSANAQIFYALLSTGQPLTITGGTNAIVGTVNVMGTIGGGYFTMSGPVANETGGVNTVNATIPDFVKVTSRVGYPVVSGNTLSATVPAISYGNGQVQVRLRMRANYDAAPISGPWVNYTGPGQSLSATVPAELQNTGEHFPLYTIGVKDTVAEWPDCGWLLYGDYIEARNSPAEGGYAVFYAPNQPDPLTNAQLQALLPESRLSGKHITVALTGDSRSEYVYATYTALLNTLRPGKFTVIDGGMAGKGSADFLPNAVNVHRNSTTGQNYFHYITDGLIAAKAAGDVVVDNFELGSNSGGNSVQNDPIIINAQIAAIPDLIEIIHPCRTFARADQQNKNDEGAFIAASDGQRAIAAQSTCDRIFLGTEKLLAFFATHQQLADAGFLHPLVGAGQESQSRFWIESLFRTLAFVLPVPVATVTVSPANVILEAGQETQAFGAIAKDVDGIALPTQPAFAWSIDAPQISNIGLLSVPDYFLVKAVAGGVTGTATATLPLIPSVPFVEKYLRGPLNAEFQFAPETCYVGDTFGVVIRLTDGDDLPVAIADGTPVYVTVTGGGETLTDSEPATIEYGPDGRIRYDLQAADTETAGRKQMTISVGAPGNRQTFGPVRFTVQGR